MKPTIITPKAAISKDASGNVTERICFPMREVSSSEESAFWLAMSELSDKPKDEKIKLQFDLMVETIAEWTEEMPFTQQYRRPDDGTVVEERLNGDDPATAVLEFFKGRTMKQERMAHAIINKYSNELAADVVF